MYSYHIGSAPLLTTCGKCSCLQKYHLPHCQNSPLNNYIAINLALRSCWDKAKAYVRKAICEVCAY